MCRPCTSWPARSSSRAATALSTPPDSAAMTRPPMILRAPAARGWGGGVRERLDEVWRRVEIEAAPREVVVEAAEHERTSQPIRRGGPFRQAVPVHRLDASIEPLARVMIMDLAGERDAQRAATVAGIA